MRVACLNEHPAGDLSVFEAFSISRGRSTQNPKILLRLQDFQSSLLEIGSDKYFRKDFADGPPGVFVDSAIECDNSAKSGHRITSQGPPISFFRRRAQGNAGRIRVLDNCAS